VRITILGSASGLPVPHRSSSSLFLEVGGRGYLFDIGEGCSSSLMRIGIDQEIIRAGFISHMHPDHSSGLPLLIQLMHLSGRQAPFEIYLPAEAREGMEVCLRTLYLFPERLSFPLKLLPMRANLVFQKEGFSVSAFPNNHLQGYRQVADPGQKLESYSFEIEGEGKIVDYSGDIGSLADLKSFVSSPYLLITECMHTDIEELLHFVSQRGINKTLLTHIPIQLEGKEGYIKSLARKLGAEGVRMAYDGLGVEL
jgi:ribonuclease BN (tRNA processing enzyme)